MILTMFTQAWRMRRYLNQKTVENPGTNWLDCGAAIRVRNGSPVRAACVCTRFFSIRTIQNEFPLRSRPQAPFGPMMVEKLGNPSIAPEHAVHAKALGRDAERRHGRFMEGGQRKFAD